MINIINISKIEDSQLRWLKRCFAKAVVRQGFIGSSPILSVQKDLMISTYNCTDQQVVDWHYRTVCRYQLAAKPGTQGFAANLLKIATNAIAFDRFLKSQKVKKYTLPPRVKIKKVQRNTT